MKIEISDTELKNRQVKGTVFICRSCLDNRNKIVMVDYKNEGSIPKGIHYRFCSDCLDLMGDCGSCRNKMNK